jgi:hypothetical protein
MEKTAWAERVKNEVLRAVKVERKILLTIKRSKANWIGHIWRRNCLLKHVIEGKTEGSKELTGRRGIILLVNDQRWEYSQPAHDTATDTE